MSDSDSSTRADAVRARREKRLKQGAARKQRTTAPPPPEARSARSAPILMRGVKADVPVQRKKPSRVRRRYDISLGSPGAEMRLPAVPLVRPSWRWLSSLIVSGLVVLLWMMWNHPTFLVATIEIQGLQRLDAREVHLVLGIRNASIFSLDPAEMSFELGRAFPEFYEVDVRVGLWNNVTITVNERLPVMGWVNSQGMVLVDKNGISFPARGLVNGDIGTGQSFPIVEAPELVMKPPDLESTGESAEEGFVLNPYVNRELLKPHQVEAVLEMSRSAPAEAKIIFDPKHGMGWKDPAGWIVYFGQDGSDMHAKLQMYKTIVQDLQSRNVTPAFISVEFIHAPYYRMER